MFKVGDEIRLIDTSENRKYVSDITEASEYELDDFFKEKHKIIDIKHHDSYGCENDYPIFIEWEGAELMFKDDELYPTYNFLLFNIENNVICQNLK